MSLNDPDISEFLTLAASIEAAGYKPGPVFAKVTKIREAIWATIGEESYFNGDDLLNLPPREVADRVRQTAVNRGLNGTLSTVAGAFENRLMRSAQAELNATSDDLIKAMRKDFDAALEVVKAAAALGLTTDTDPAALLEAADGVDNADVISVYRKLGPAVAKLDQLAALRNQLTTVGGVGAGAPPAAAFVTDVATTGDLTAAWDTWRGQFRTTIVEGNGYSAPVRQLIPRLGGSWLALLEAGYTVHLNTGLEAEAIALSAAQPELAAS